MNTSTRKLISKEVQQDADGYVGTIGEIWYQEGTQTLRFGDATTPGGLPLEGGGMGDLTNTGLTTSVWLGEPVHFIKNNNENTVDEIAPGISITRGSRGFIFNPSAGDSFLSDNQPYVQNSSNAGQPYWLSPTNTEWNADGWADLSDVTVRSYSSWNDVMNNNPPGLIGQELVLHDVTNNTYYTVKFQTWQPGAQGGAFSYVRRQINVLARFTRVDDGDETDNIAPGLTLARDSGGAIYNIDAEDGWNYNESPVGTLWNMDGWSDLATVTSRQYLTFYSIFGAGRLGKKILGKQLVMHDVINDAYWKIQFTHWTPNGNGGGFSYTREQIDVSNPQSGLTFSDYSSQTTAFTEQTLGIVPQLKYTASYERYFNLADIGKHIVITQSGVNLIMPDYTAQAFPLGSAITVVNMSGGTIYIQMDNDDENNTIYGAGTSDNGTRWMIPDQGGGNIATLLKIQSNSAGDGNGHNWILSGPGIQLD